MDFQPEKRTATLAGPLSLPPMIATLIYHNQVVDIAMFPIVIPITCILSCTGSSRGHSSQGFSTPSRPSSQESYSLTERSRTGWLC